VLAFVDYNKRPEKLLNCLHTAQWLIQTAEVSSSYMLILYNLSYLHPLLIANRMLIVGNVSFPPDHNFQTNSCTIRLTLQAGVVANSYTLL
jgi:hypothetical protein